MLNSITPFFIVDDLAETIKFYELKLGFEVRYKGGGDVPDEDYWAMVGRDQIMIMLKHITPDIHPQPSSSRHEWIAWDAYIFSMIPTRSMRSIFSRMLPFVVPCRIRAMGCEPSKSPTTTDTSCALDAP